MKTLTTLLILCCCITSLAQENSLVLEGKIVNQNGYPIADVYIVNPRTLEKDITGANGIFTVKVLPSDSLIFSHISYFRKSVRIFELQQNPEVVLESENIKIPEVIVSPDKTTDYERAKKNLEFLEEFKPQKYNKMKPEIDPTQTIMTEHNRLMRTEAGSVSFLPIIGAPIQLMDNALKKRKRRKLFATDYYSTRKQKEPVTDTIPNQTEENN